jgi:DNA-binding transcriptional MocR family regulator
VSIARSWPKLTVRVPPEIFEPLERLASASGLNMSEALRLVLTDYFSNGDKQAIDATMWRNALARAYIEIRQAVDGALVQFR